MKFVEFYEGGKRHQSVHQPRRFGKMQCQDRQNVIEGLYQNGSAGSCLHNFVKKRLGDACCLLVEALL